MSKLFGQPRYGLGEEIVDDVVGLRVQLMKEQLDLISDSVLRVLEKHANVNNLALELQHVI